MRIASYNVLGLTGFRPEAARPVLGDPERRVAHFARVFGGLEADVLALQEGPPLDVARRIADQMGCHLAMFPSPAHWPGYLLSRHFLRESRTFSHLGPGGPQGPFSRCFGAARVEVAGHELWVVDLHLHPSQPPLRAQETEGLATRLSELELERLPGVVLGDFNSVLGEPAHDMLAARGYLNAMECGGGGVQPTMDTAGIRPAAIDHIYVSPALTGALRSAHVVRAPGFRLEAPIPEGAWVHSDHLPVIAEIDWP